MESRTIWERIMALGQELSAGSCDEEGGPAREAGLWRSDSGAERSGQWWVRFSELTGERNHIWELGVNTATLILLEFQPCYGKGADLGALEFQGTVVFLCFLLSNPFFSFSGSSVIQILDLLARSPGFLFCFLLLCPVYLTLWKISFNLIVQPFF